MISLSTSQWMQKHHPKKKKKKQLQNGDCVSFSQEMNTQRPKFFKCSFVYPPNTAEKKKKKLIIKVEQLHRKTRNKAEKSTYE